MHPQGFKVFVGGLSPETMSDQLHEYFAQWGEIVDHIVMMNGSGGSRGFGFVTFTDEAAAQRVVEQKIHELMGKNVECKAAVAGEKQQPGYVPPPQAAVPSYGGGGGGGGANNARALKLFIGGLQAGTTTENLAEYFQQFGELTDAIAMNTRGFGYVTFVDQNAVEQVMRTPKEHVIMDKVVECKRCIPKENMPSAPRMGGAPAFGVRPSFMGGKGAAPPPQYMPAPAMRGAPRPRPQFRPPAAQAPEEEYANAYATGYAAAKLELQRQMRGGAPY